MTFEEYVQKHLGVSGMSYEDMELVGLGWAAHRDHGSCSEIPNSSDPDSRQALEGESRPSLGQRKAAQIGQTIGVLAQNKEGRVCAVTDLGRCTWLSEDVTGAGVCLCGEVKWQDCPLHGSKQEQSE